MLLKRNNIALYIAVIFCFLIFTYSCNRVDISDRIELKHEVDLKKINISDCVTFDVLLKNNFDKDIAIKYIQTGCGCLSYDSNILNQVISPNDSLLLQFKYRPNTTGYNERNVNIFLNLHRTRLKFKLKCFVRDNLKDK